MEDNLLASESFSNGDKHYFFDFRMARNRRCYIRIARNDLKGDKRLRRSALVIFEEDFGFVIGAFASLFRSATYLQEMPEESKKPGGGIKSWEPQLRPRERLLAHGSEALEDHELLAILIGSGTPQQSAVDLAAAILRSVDGDLERLQGLTAEALCAFRGMGPARSLTLIAAGALAERRFAPMARMKNMRTVERGGSAA